MASMIAHSRFIRRLLGVLFAMGILFGVSTVGAAAAHASAGIYCYSGRDSGTTNWAWGSCTGIPQTYDNDYWRLHVSCTWGLHADSPYYDDNRRVDVECPWPSSVRSTQIQVNFGP